MEKEEISLVPFKKALDSLKRSLAQEKNEFTRDASIQRFEYTYELCWKTLKRYLELLLNIKEYNIKEIYRKAAQAALISDVEAWFSYHQARNLTSHTYDENTADEAYEAASKFVIDAEILYNILSPKFN